MIRIFTEVDEYILDAKIRESINSTNSKVKAIYFDRINIDIKDRKQDNKTTKDDSNGEFDSILQEEIAKYL